MVPEKKVYRVSYIGRDPEETDLGDDARIRFILPNGAELEVHHAGPQDQPGTLMVYVRNGWVRVLPCSSNVIAIEVSDPTNIRAEYGPKRRVVKERA